MIETHIAITVNRKSDITTIEKEIINSSVQSPVYIREYERSFQINFTSDYEQWELDQAILDRFPEYEFTQNLENGRKEIRVQLSRYQSEFSTDGWGRRIENPLDETKYLVKKSVKEIEKFNPAIRVLFENNEQHYFVNIMGGFNKTTNEEGFLLLDNFKTPNEDQETEFLKDRLYKSPLEAFHSGYHKLKELVDSDYTLYLEAEKKAIREQQKIPRKIIRDFINACNKSDLDGIVKNLSEDIVFEKLERWKTILTTNGTEELRAFLTSSTQELCTKDFKIRSQWYFDGVVVTIGLKYFSMILDSGATSTQKFKQLKFEFMGHKIISIVEIN
jgi:hypothetical protein